MGDINLNPGGVIGALVCFGGVLSLTMVPEEGGYHFSSRASFLAMAIGGATAFAIRACVIILKTIQPKLLVAPFRKKPKDDQ